MTGPAAEYRSEFLRAIVERGYLHQATDLAGLDALAARTRLVAYIGFDATATCEIIYLLCTCQTNPSGCPGSLRSSGNADL